MIIKNITLKEGPLLTFIKPLPVKGDLAKNKKTLLLEVVFHDSQKNIQKCTSEVPLLDGYSLYSSCEIFNYLDDIKPQILNKCFSNERLELLFQKIPAPLFNAFEVLALKQSTQISYPEIKIRGLEDNKLQFVKFKISKKNIYETVSKIKNCYNEKSCKQIVLDANCQLGHLEWELFFTELNKVERNNELQIIIEEPMEFIKLSANNFYKIFSLNNTQIAIDESLANWIKQHESNKVILNRLKIYQYLVFKPGMISSLHLNQILEKSKHIKTNQVLVSCLYEGPWNLKYYFHLINHLGLSQPAGLGPLLDIKENLAHIQLNDSRDSIRLL